MSRYVERTDGPAIDRADVPRLIRKTTDVGGIWRPHPGATVGSPFTAALFPGADWTSAEPVEFPERPYPGWRPRGSWGLAPDGQLHALVPTKVGWLDRCTGETVSVAGRRLVLGYGSNLNPAKLAARLGGGEIIALRGAVVGWAAAWCNGRRGAGAGEVVATLVPAPGHVEVHAVLALTDAQVELMDGWEGHPRWYRRQPFVGTIWMEDGTLLMGDIAQTDVEVYLGCAGVRSPLLIAGRPLLCAAAPHDEVSQLLDLERTP